MWLLADVLSDPVALAGQIVGKPNGTRGQAMSIHWSLPDGGPSHTS